MRRLVNRFRALQETVVLLTVVIEHASRVASYERVQDVVDLGRGFHRLTLHYGFVEEPDLHGDLAMVLPRQGVVDASDQLVYVVGRETFVATDEGRMGAAWESLFAFLSRNAKSETDYFRLPPEQVIEVGAYIDL